MFRFSPQAIARLVEVVTGGSGMGGPRRHPGVYRKASQLELFFGNCGLELRIGGGSRVPTVQAVVTEANMPETAMATLKPVFEAAVDATAFDDPNEHLRAVEYLNEALIGNELKLRRRGSRYVLDPLIPNNNITEITRRTIFDRLEEEELPWQGKLSQVDFLRRLYQLNNLASTDSRLSTFPRADDDITQHTQNNDDWKVDWILDDPRFNLAECDDAEFLRFLCETVHPLVQRDSSTVSRLIAIYNESLAADGFALVATKYASGQPLFEARETRGAAPAVALEPRSAPPSKVAEVRVTETLKPVTVFVAYAREDEVWRSQLVAHLSAARRAGIISDWFDRKIEPGQDWKTLIDSHLNECRLFILLVSADFIASDYCVGIEMETALQRRSAGEAEVIPVIVRDCDWKGMTIGGLQALPRDGRPISSWSNVDEALADIARGVRMVAEKLRAAHR